jgi:hypothetical protein
MSNIDQIESLASRIVARPCVWGGDMMDHEQATEHGGDRAARDVATTYDSMFNPFGVQAFQEAFERAWAEVHDDPIIRTDEQSAREMIAQRIVAAARAHGERDPDRLVRHALAVFKT